MKYTEQFIKRIPKTDLHLHLDGSLRLPTLIELSKERKINLPSHTPEGLKEQVFKERYASLDEYLKGFAYTCSVLQDAEALERVSYELALDCFEEGVRYIEVRFAPQLHMSDSMSFEDVMLAVDRGLKKARAEINATIPENEPEFEFGIIVCAMRFCNEYFSSYYADFFRVHEYSDPLETIAMLSMELAKAGVKLKRESDVQIVGFDLAGSENGFPAINHRNAYDYIHKNFIMKTVHAGEAYGPESIFQAITALHADRIGHGLFLFDDSKIRDEAIVDRKRYVSELSNYIAERRVSIEVCLTSNMQTVPEIRTIAEHPFGKMLENRLSLTICTDNRLVSNTTICKELGLALDNFPITPKELKDIIIYGFKRSFFPRSYGNKRSYVRKILEYYAQVEMEEGIS